MAQFLRDQSKPVCENRLNFLGESLWTFTVMVGLNLSLPLSTSLCLQPVIKSVALAKHLKRSQTHSQYYKNLSDSPHLYKSLRTFLTGNMEMLM